MVKSQRIYEGTIYTGAGPIGSVPYPWVPAAADQRIDATSYATTTYAYRTTCALHCYTLPHCLFSCIDDGVHSLLERSTMIAREWGASHIDRSEWTVEALLR